MRAYRVTIVNHTFFSDLEIIVAASSPGKAKYSQYLTAVEMGLRVSFTDFRAVRAPEYDHLATKPRSLGWKHDGLSVGVCYIEI